MTREPEMVQAYRDTWELGLHSYLTYLRDRLLLSRELLAPSGSIFVQISDENLHHVREVMDEVFGAENFSGILSFFKTSSQSTNTIPSVVDYVICYARNHERQKLRSLHHLKAPGERGAKQYISLISPDLKEVVRMNENQINGSEPLPEGWKVCALGPLTSQGFQKERSGPFVFEGTAYSPPPNRHWSYDPKPGGEMERLVTLGRIRVSGKALRSVLLADDNPVTELDNVWLDTGVGSFTEDQVYVVQTNTKVVQRCLLMTTGPGDLVLDPTCGSGTTAYVAEQWGRRWITCDTSRVPLALARQRLLTATFDYYKLKDDQRGPAGGFVYERRQNQKGEEVGGIVPHITLKSIANNEPPAEEVLVDRPELAKGVVRVTGPFSFEATIPTAEGLDTKPETPGIQGEAHENYVQRMLEVLRRAPVLRLPGNQTVTLKNIRPPAKTLALSAEAVVDKPSLTNLADDASKQPALTRDTDAVAILFGPENGPLSERLVREAWDEAGLKHYSRLYVIGFAIDPKARQFIDSAAKIGLPCTYLQATMDLQMGDLLKNMRSSQIFSVCGLPDVGVSKVQGPKSKATAKDHASRITDEQWQAELLGLDTFDPVTMEADHLKATDVPAWLLDTDYNGMVFRVRQAFFPRTGAWENLKRSLRVEFEDTVWDHLAGTTSAPFPAGEHGQIAVKVIDPRGNELLVVKKLEETK
jgi:adenine-specific DNA-methyltransferase